MTLRVVQINCLVDTEDRTPQALLEAWPTLPAVATATARAGADVTILQASRTTDRYRSDGVAYHFVAEPKVRRGGGAGLFPWRLAAAARAESPDIIHFNGLDFPVHARAASSLGVPVLVQDHASRPEARIGRLRGWGHRRIAAAAFTSSAQAEPFLRSGQLPAGASIFEIPESSSGFTAGDREKARRDAGIYGDPALLWVGHLDANKDPLTILQALRKALPALPDLQLWCAFVGTALLPQLEKLLHEDETLAAHVHLLGKISHEKVQTLCRACDFFLLGSRREGSGYALLEALACGTTPIVSDIPPFRALTGNGSVGALVPVGEADAFAASILSLAKRPRLALRQAALDHFDQHLSFPVLGRRLVAAYETLTGKSAAQ